MNLIVEDDELDEVLIDDIVKSNDNGIVIPNRQGDRGEGKSEEEKEIIAQDAIVLGPTEAAKIHGTTPSRASRYGNGLDVKEDTKSEILNKKHEIGNVAVTKLMESLELFEPNDLEKPLDKVRAARDLAGIVEKMSGNKNGIGSLAVHFHAPRQRSESEFKTIEVS